ncbi:hypothetical protein DL766_007885 [Monosporascus sp. MC13-8B]|nr:hypothetical protein DL766_007885 [Monosporascus sp. MC13-8B]
MRLLNSHTLDFEEFSEPSIPEYAILSHTWGGEEVVYQDMRGGIPWWRLKYKYKAGWQKIRNCAQQARRDGLRYIWVDTCCIDKSSSAELQESINSMYRWYQNAKVCYAYLSDADVCGSGGEKEGQHCDDDPPQFRRCRWFSRGFTLQELLAPRSVVFFARDWTPLGDRAGLAALIASITGIGEEYLEHGGGNDNLLHRASVACRMSWAAGRETTRGEDAAYCLLGIFGIHMPLLYGEGITGAFRRLQEEIMRATGDTSILAWGHRSRNPGSQPSGGGYLASSPLDFMHCARVADYAFSGVPRISFGVSQHGLEATLPVYEDPNFVLAYGVLNCADGIGSRNYYTAMTTPEGAVARRPLLAVPLCPAGDGDFVRAGGFAPVELDDSVVLRGTAPVRRLCVKRGGGYREHRPDRRRVYLKRWSFPGFDEAAVYPPPNSFNPEFVVSWSKNVRRRWGNPFEFFVHFVESGDTCRRQQQQRRPNNGLLLLVTVPFFTSSKTAEHPPDGDGDGGSSGAVCRLARVPADLSLLRMQELMANVDLREQLDYCHELEEGDDGGGGEVDDVATLELDFRHWNWNFPNYSETHRFAGLRNEPSALKWPQCLIEKPGDLVGLREIT